MSDVVFLIDGTNWAHKHYHISGESGMVGGLENWVRVIDDHFKPKHIAIAFDAPGESWRKQLYPQYKAQRPTKDESLERGLAACVDRLSVDRDVMYVSGVEADDLVASRCQHAIDTGHRVVCCSSDKDLYQLLRVDQVTQMTSLRTYRGKLQDAKFFTHAEFVTLFGFLPLQWPQYRALCGDKSDNVAGVESIGSKAAGLLLQRFATVEDAIADQWNCALTGKQLAKLRAAIDDGSYGAMLRVCTLDRKIDLLEEAAL
jgi:5'-3' exonuclease